MSITVDASVFVSAGCSSEIYHEASLRFLRQLRSRGEHIFCPSLFLVECVSAIARQTGQAILSEGNEDAHSKLPEFVPDFS
jgi:predicted nucleic acid-binding protein